MKTKYKQKFIKKYIEHKYLFLIFLPFAAYIFIFRYVPIYGVIMAFKEYSFFDGILKSPWIGLDNFREMFAGRTFMRVFFNTMIISIYKLIFIFPASIVLALMLNNLKDNFFKKFSQTVTYIPYFLSWVVVSGIIIQLISPVSGPLGYIFQLLNMKPINFVSETVWFRPLLVASAMWKNVGWGTIIYLAAISMIDISLYDAAHIDGANKIKQIIYITIPSLIPVITMMFLLNIGSLIYDDFDQIFNMYNTAVYSVGDVISTYVYREGLARMQFGYGTAVGLFRNVLALILVFSTNQIMRKYNEYALF